MSERDVFLHFRFLLEDVFLLNRMVGLVKGSVVITPPSGGPICKGKLLLTNLKGVWTTLTCLKAVAIIKGSATINPPRCQRTCLKEVSLYGATFPLSGRINEPLPFVPNPVVLLNATGWLRLLMQPLDEVSSKNELRTPRVY